MKMTLFSLKLIVVNLYFPTDHDIGLLFKILKF